MREHDLIKNIRYLRIHKNQVVYVKPVTIQVEDLPIKAYYYYDQKCEKDDSETFYKKLYWIVKELKNRKVKSREYYKIVLEIADKYYEYLAGSSKHQFKFND